MESEPQSIVQRHALIGLAALVIVLFGCYAFAVTFWKPIADPTIQGMILGILGTGGFGGIMQYFFGSSAGSKAKDDQLAKLQAPQQTPQVKP